VSERIVAATRYGLVLATGDREGWTVRTTSDADTRCLATDPRSPQVLYAGLQGPGTGGCSISLDAGRTWKRARGLDRGYGWSVAADPERPDVAYLSAARTLSAHSSRCDATIFRLENRRWRRRVEGLPPRLHYLPVLATTVGIPGRVDAMVGDELWRSSDHGLTWTRLPLRFPGRVRAFAPYAEPANSAA